MALRDLCFKEANFGSGSPSEAFFKKIVRRPNLKSLAEKMALLSLLSDGDSIAARLEREIEMYCPQ